jgi:hypothetical protein
MRSSSGAIGVELGGRLSAGQAERAARTITSGIAASMHVTGMPSIVSMRLPVGKSDPVTAPQASRKSRRIGAAVPATPSMPSRRRR